MATDKAIEIMEYRRKGLGYKRIAAVTSYFVNTIKSVCWRNTEAPGKRCIQCGAVMVQPLHRKEKKFCSDKCRMAWWKAHPERMNRKAFYHLVCVHCGQPFDSYGNNQSVLSKGCASSRCVTATVDAALLFAFP